MDLFSKATDPLFYDSGELEWQEEGETQSPTRQLVREYLDKVVDLEGKTLVDIGSGTGAFFDFYKEKGAVLVEGIEPSKKNYAILKSKYPNISVNNISLEEYTTSKTFDCVTSIIVFEHIADLDSSFQKINKILNNGGRFYLVIANMEYFLTPRFDYDLKVQNLPNSEYVVASRRSYGTYYDIVRPIENYMKSADKAGFQLIKSIGITPTENFIKLAPKYEQFKNTNIFNLLIFEKKS